MPEIPLCLYCNRVVLMEEQDYVILNKRESRSSEWQYAHVSCHVTAEAIREQAPEDFAVAV